MSALDRNIFELQQLEIRTLLATGTASVDATNTLQVGNLSGAATVVVNKISNGKIVVTVDNAATGPTGPEPTRQFTLGNSAGQFNKININGSGSADTITISGNFDYSGGATIAGNGGNDVLNGGKGNDLVSGLAGNDTMDGGLGNDQLAGGTGFDQTNYSTRTGALRVTLDNAFNDGEVGISEADNVQTEEVIGGAGNDTMTGSSGDDFFGGGAGADSLSGGAGNDELTGSGSQDKLFGEQGDDFLQAQNNDQDTVNGGTGPGASDFDLANIDGIDVASGASPASPAAAMGPLSDWVVPVGAGDPTSSGAGDGGVIGSLSAPVTGSPSDLDTTYGSSGKVSQNLGWEPVAAAVDSQGRVVFVGTDNSFNGQGYGNDFAIARFTAGGALDTTFGTNGQTRVDFTSVSGSGYGNESDVARGVVIGPGDKIIVVGSHIEGGGYSSDSDSAVARLTNTGALDATFNTNGRVIVDASTDGFGDEAHDAAVQLDEAIVVGGTAGGSGTVFRLLDNGLPDPSFNAGQPRLITDLTSLNAVALQTFQGDGTTQLILLGGDLDGDLAIERLQPNGARDFNFANNGLATHDFSGVSQNSLNDLAVDASNNILAAADANTFTAGSAEALAPPANTQQAVLAKFDAGGTLVGSATHDATDGFASFGAVTVDSAGRYIAVGFADSDFLVERVTSAMAPDTTFSSTGFVLTDFGSDGFSDDAAFATRQVAGGKIIAAGNSFVGESSLASIARYQGVATSGNTDKEGNVTEVEEVINYQDLHQQPPPPELQRVFDRISDGAKFYILSQPDDQGVARLDLGLLGDGNGDDKVLISLVKGGKDGTKGDRKFVAVNCNGEVLYYDDDTTTRIEIFTRGGNDNVDVKGDIKTPLLIDGGDGDDNIEGGKADDILLGGPDKDFIEGNEGRDIIIGGKGADNLNGKQEEDIIIAGTTAHDGDEAALVALSDEWGSKDNFNTRLAFLRGGGGANGSFVLRGSSAGFGATVFDDGAIDILRGEGGKDWFFARTGGANADIVTQIEGGDVRDAI